MVPKASETQVVNLRPDRVLAAPCGRGGSTTFLAEAGALVG